MRLTAYERRLDAASSRPVAVALSGGADSILALRQTVAWARDCGRPVVALIVDHRLQAQSADWAAFAAQAARDLGAVPKVLIWDGPHPARGVPAAARNARHRLLAEAARAAEARVIVTGHTGSDAQENAALGQGALHEWSPSPAWPQGRGIFLLRPLLHLSRGQVRARLAEEGISWIDDPANENDGHPRIAARRAMVGQAPDDVTPDDGMIANLARLARFDHGRIVLPRNALAEAGETAPGRVLGAAMVSAGGGAAIPRADRLARLAARLAGAERVSATLAGARIEAGEAIAIWRDAGELARGGLAPLDLAAGQTGVWDGRYAITLAAGGEVCALKGRAAGLAPSARRALKAWPATVRPGLPIVLGPDGDTVCPILASAPGQEAQWLVPARFLAACGALPHERDLLP